MIRSIGRRLRSAARVVVSTGFLAATGGVCGVVALVWTAYLSGVHTGEREARLQADLRVTMARHERDIDQTSDRIEAAKATGSPNSPPEVWTRMAGLNVWIAGKREPEGKQKPRIVIMLHGFGKPRGALLTMAEREAAKFGTVFVFPEAPFALDWRRRAWWRPSSLLTSDGTPLQLRNGRTPNRAKTVVPGQEVVAARRLIIKFLTEARQQFRVTNEELVLAGFSQGATLALDVALHLSQPLGGLAFLSGKPLDPSVCESLWGKLRDVPVLVAHGQYDTMTSFSAVDAMQRTMKRAGIHVVWVPHDGGHEIHPSAQWQLRRFIRRPRGSPVGNAEAAGALQLPEALRRDEP